MMKLISFVLLCMTSMNCVEISVIKPSQSKTTVQENVTTTTQMPSTTSSTAATTGTTVNVTLKVENSTAVNNVNGTATTTTGLLECLLCS